MPLLRGVMPILAFCHYRRLIILLLVFHIVLEFLLVVPLYLLPFLLITKLRLLILVDGLGIGILSLHVPVLVKQIVLASQLLSHFSDQVQVLLGDES